MEAKKLKTPYERHREIQKETLFHNKATLDVVKNPLKISLKNINCKNRFVITEIENQ